MKQPTIQELNERYKGQHIRVNDDSHPDFGKKCVFVEMVSRSFDKNPVMVARILTEGRLLELTAKQVIFILAEIPLPSPKDN